VDQAYSWTLKESEFSTDLLFRSEAALARLYPPLLHYGITHFGGREILRFLGKRLPVEGCPANFQGEAQSTLRQRPEGVRLKHFVAGNSVKMYDKEQRILRVETTSNRPREFRVFRESDAASRPAWRPMRKGIADVQRRAEVSQRRAAARSAQRRRLAAQRLAQPRPAAPPLSRSPLGKRRPASGRTSQPPAAVAAGTPSDSKTAEDAPLSTHHPGPRNHRGPPDGPHHQSRCAPQNRRLEILAKKQEILR
jgi:hypothetical protein